MNFVFVCQVLWPAVYNNHDSSLFRQQQLSEVDDLYQSGQYELLAGTLTECFQFCAQQTDNDISEFDNLPDRATQMAMLLDSLWQLKKYPVRLILLLMFNFLFFIYLFHLAAHESKAL